MSRVANSNSRLTHGLEAYTKVKVIGKGSYGEVWLVQHKRDKKQYVFKRMNLSRSSERERNAAEQEAKLLAKLKHPNIVSYKDSFETPSHDLYIVMGFCEGGDLYSRLKQQKGDSLDERQVVEWFVQIAMALQYMHERNILHRDLKTQNIFLTKSKIIKVGDLGIARVLDSSNDMATTHIGTPYYMSPELFSDKPYNHRSDVWALGCCVYEMATLRHAFNARDMNSLVYKILKGKMPIMPKIYSIELCNLIKAMLNHNPDKRPSVNRILRDPYIKKNIAMFLESTKRTRASSQASRNDKSTAVPKSNNTRVAKSSSTPSNRSAALVEKLEPLNVGPDLDPIVEEATPRVTPTPRVGSASRHSHESRSHSSQSRPALPSKSSDKSPSPSRHKSAQHRSSPSPSRQRHRRKDSIDEKPHTNDRPLPPKPPSVSQPKQSTAMPTKSRIKSRESGYGSVSSAHSQEDSRQSSRTNSSSVSDVQNSQGDRRQSETPRPMSARAKRRERIEIVTPRISSSVDLKPSRVRVKSDSTDNRSRSHGSRPLSGEPRLRHIQNSPPILRPPKSAHSSVEKSTDSNCRDEVDAVAVKVNSSDVHKSDSSSSLRQRSLGDDSSSTNSTDEEVIEEKEERRNSTEMVNFISVLDSTLHAGSNRPEDKGIDPGEEENIGAVPVVVETSEVLRGLEYRGDDVSPEIDVDDITSKPQQSRRYNDNNPGPVNTLGTSTRLAARIQLLRKDCVVNLGYKKLKAAYDILNNVTGDSLEERMIELLGQKDYDMFAGKIWQLKFCEDAVFVL